MVNTWLVRVGYHERLVLSEEITYFIIFYLLNIVTRRQAAAVTVSKSWNFLPNLS